MVINHLTDLLIDFCSQVFSTADYLETGKGAYRAPSIIDGFLEFKNSRDSEDFPYVIIRPFKGEIIAANAGEVSQRGDRNVHRITVLFIIGTHAEDMQGYRDGLNILQRLLIAFEDLPGHILGGKFRLIESKEWEVQESSSYPQWITTLQATFETGIPQG